MSHSISRNTPDPKPEFSHDIRVKYSLLCATLALIALMAYRSWGTWDQLFNVTIAPVVIAAAWFHWRRQLSAWSLVPAFLLSVLYLSTFFGYFNIFGYSIFSGHGDLRTYDVSLLSVDSSFGFEPSIWLRHTVDRVHMLWFFNCVYNCLPLAMAVAYVAHLRSGKRVLYIPVVLGVAMVGVLLYRVLPACGPIFLLGTDHFAGDCGAFCTNIASLTIDKTSLFDSSLVDLRWPRNAWPSLHVIWALLTFWICRDLKWGRWIAGVFLIGTALSTLVTGEHYLVDVIAAFPVSLVVWQVCVGEVPLGHPRRVLSIMGGGLMLLLWVAAIRVTPEVFWLSPVLPWSAAMVTVGGSLLSVSRHPGQQFLPGEAPTLPSAIAREQQAELVGVD